MEPGRGPIRNDERADDADGTEIRAAVDWYFGELVDEVAVDCAVSCDQLVGALERIEREARSRRNQLDGRAEQVSTAGAPGEVLTVPVGTFQVLTRACGLSDAESEAVRQVHRRMARAIATVPDDDDDDRQPLVYVASPADLH